MTTMKKLLMFAVAGLAPAVASADVGTATYATVLQSPRNDKAPTTGTPARLKRTDSEQAGHEMSTLAFFAGNTEGLYFTMSTELPPATGTTTVRPANHRVQLSATPFKLQQ